MKPVNTTEKKHRPGSQQALRERNAQKILKTLATVGPQTQSYLAKATGLSGGTVSNIVRRLSAEGLITANPATIGGRRATQVKLRPTGQYLLGIDIGRTHLSMALADSARNIRVNHASRLPNLHTPQNTLLTVSKILGGILAEAGATHADISECVIAVPASIRPSDFSIVQDTIFRTWAGRDLRALAEHYLQLPVRLENDANIGALAQVTFGEFQDARNVLYVKNASGIGLGIVQNPVTDEDRLYSDSPRIYSSSTGLTGEIGHTQHSDTGEICYCGNRGCLETVASLGSIVANLNRIRPDEHYDTDAVIKAASENDIVVMRMLSDAGTALGKALADHINILAPDVVVLGGPLCVLGDLFLDLVVPSTRQRLLPAVASTVKFATTSMGNETEVYGCVALAAQLMWNAPVL